MHRRRALAVVLACALAASNCVQAQQPLCMGVATRCDLLSSVSCASQQGCSSDYSGGSSSSCSGYSFGCATFSSSSSCAAQQGCLWTSGSGGGGATTTPPSNTPTEPARTPPPARPANTDSPVPDNTAGSRPALPPYINEQDGKCLVPTDNVASGAGGVYYATGNYFGAAEYDIGFTNASSCVTTVLPWEDFIVNTGLYAEGICDATTASGGRKLLSAGNGGKQALARKAVRLGTAQLAMLEQFKLPAAGTQRGAPLKSLRRQSGGAAGRKLRQEPGTPVTLPDQQCSAAYQEALSGVQTFYPSGITGWAYFIAQSPADDYLLCFADVLADPCWFGCLNIDEFFAATQTTFPDICAAAAQYQG